MGDFYFYNLFCKTHHYRYCITTSFQRSRQSYFLSMKLTDDQGAYNIHSVCGKYLDFASF